jgi:hypothetical protein
MSETAGTEPLSRTSWLQVVIDALARRGASALVAASAILCFGLGSAAALLPDRVFWLIVVATTLGVLSVRWPAAGVVTAFVAIPLTAWLRRVTGGPEAYVENDPLVLLPTLAVCVSLLAIWPNRGLLQRMRNPLLLLAVSVLISGVVGLGANVAAGSYGLATQLVPILLALAAAAGCWPSVWTAAVRVLLLLGPLVGAYGIVQRFAPASYDLAWLLDRQRIINSIGEPEPGAFRIFGTMESPGPFAFFLALSLLSWLAWSLSQYRTGNVSSALAGLVPIGVVSLALAVTAVRTALIAVPISLVAWAVLGRRKDALPRLVMVGAVATAALILPLALGPAVGSASLAASRFDLTSITSDVSFQDRALLLGQFGSALINPVGHGLGTTGTPASLASGNVETVDNGYLARTLESGALGLALFLVVAVLAAKAAHLEARWSHAWEADARLLVIIAFLWFDVSGPTTSTAVGLFFWAAVGSALTVATTAGRRTSGSLVRA